MSSLLKSLLSNQGLALESEEVISSAPEGTVEEVEEAHEATVAVTEEADTIVEATDDAESVEEAQASLESLCLAMESALKTTRGMSARELAMTQRAGAYAVAPLGLAVPRHAVSLESIEEAEVLQAEEPAVEPVPETATDAEVGPEVVARQERTEAVMESFKEMASRLGETLKKMWENIRNMLVGFWKKITDWSGMAIKKFEKQKETISKATFDRIEVDGSKLKSVSFLVGDDLTSRSVVEAAADLKTTTRSVVVDYAGNCNKELKQIVAGQTPNPVKLNVTFGALPFFKLEENKDGVYSFKVEPKTDLADKIKGKFNVHKADLLAICTNATNALKMVQAYRKAWQETDTAVNSAIKYFEGAKKLTEDKDQKDTFKESQVAVRAVARTPVAWCKLLTKSTGILGSYVSTCLSAGNKQGISSED